jgi:hypothetical protein
MHGNRVGLTENTDVPSVSVGEAIELFSLTRIFRHEGHSTQTPLCTSWPGRQEPGTSSALGFRIPGPSGCPEGAQILCA